jgi:hypothetical protein
VKILAPAKINLYLEVVGKRPDGYHELRTIMVPLGFGDEIFMKLPLVELPSMRKDAIVLIRTILPTGPHCSFLRKPAY